MAVLSKICGNLKDLCGLKDKRKFVLAHYCHFCESGPWKKHTCPALERGLWLSPSRSIDFINIENFQMEDSDADEPLGPFLRKSGHYSKIYLDHDGDLTVSTYISLGFWPSSLEALSKPVKAFGAYRICRHERMHDLGERLDELSLTVETCPFERINMNSTKSPYPYLGNEYVALPTCPCHPSASTGGRQVRHEPLRCKDEFCQRDICKRDHCRTEVTFLSYRNLDIDKSNDRSRVAIHIKRPFGSLKTLQQHQDPTTWINRANRLTSTSERSILSSHWRFGLEFVEVTSAIDERNAAIGNPNDNPDFEFMPGSSVGELEIELQSFCWKAPIVLKHNMWEDIFLEKDGVIVEMPFGQEPCICRVEQAQREEDEEQGKIQEALKIKEESLKEKAKALARLESERNRQLSGLGPAEGMPSLAAPRPHPGAMCSRLQERFRQFRKGIKGTSDPHSKSRDTQTAKKMEYRFTSVTSPALQPEMQQESTVPLLNHLAEQSTPSPPQNTIPAERRPQQGLMIPHF